jgi:hypothetical protein
MILGLIWVVLLNITNRLFEPLAAFNGDLAKEFGRLELEML